MPRIGWMFLLWVLSTSVFSAPRDFDEAKRLAERVYSDHAEEFYCGCRITWRNGGKDLVDFNSCGYRVRKDPTRAQRIEWEHVVPASWFGQPMACWRNGGRENCSRHDEAFQKIEADLHNLTPSVGEVNGDRSNMPFGLVAPDTGRYGQCATRVDRVADRVEPRDQVKGDAARIAFYMMTRYQVALDDRQISLLRKWAMQDPVDAWELERDRRIGQHMGWRNPYVAQAGKIALPLPKKPVEESVATNAPGPANGKPPSSLNQPSSVNQTSPDKPVTETARPHGKIIYDVRGNRNSKLYHLGHCPGFAQIKLENRVAFDNIAQAEAQGYKRAGNCRPLREHK